MKQLTTMRRRIGALVARMTPAEAQAKLDAINAETDAVSTRHGARGTIFHPTIRGSSVRSKRSSAN